jgi:hypothetical protein
MWAAIEFLSTVRGGRVLAVVIVGPGFPMLVAPTRTISDYVISFRAATDGREESRRTTLCVLWLEGAGRVESRPGMGIDRRRDCDDYQAPEWQP